MHFEITLKENESSNTNDSIVTFPINLKELVWATQETYSNLGTPYAPIRADNFISLTGNEFPSIPPDTHLEIKLISEDEAEKHYASNLVCCLAKNVGKKFNNERIQVIGNGWKSIFKLESENLLCAPDGTLYISPNTQGICAIQTLNDALDSYISYSILFRLSIKERTYYFVLDPVVHIRSRD